MLSIECTKQKRYLCFVKTETRAITYLITWSTVFKVLPDCYDYKSISISTKFLEISNPHTRFSKASSKHNHPNKSKGFTFNDANSVVLVSLLLTLNIFHTLF